MTWKSAKAVAADYLAKMREADSNGFRMCGNILERGVKVGEFYASGHV